MEANLPRFSFPCTATGQLFLLDTIQRKQFLPNGYEGWKTFYRANRQTQHEIRFNLQSSFHSFFYNPAPNSDTSTIMDPNLRWGVTQTADNETIRVLFTIDPTRSIGRNFKLHPSHRIILSKLFDRDDKNLYFKRSTMSNDDNPYSRYYIFHSLNPATVNPNHFLITILNTTISTVRIESAHKHIALYRMFMRANKKNDWVQLPNETEVSVLFPDVPNNIHEGVVDQFVRTVTDGTPNTRGTIPFPFPRTVNRSTSTPTRYSSSGFGHSSPQY